MKKIYSHLLGIAGLAMASAGVCNAQSATLALKAPGSPVVIDGASAEWGDSLSYYNPEKKVHYAITNDKTNLYLVVKTKDPVQEVNILAGGLTFGVDTKGKKRTSISTTFPFPAGNPSSVVKAGEDLEDKKTRVSIMKFKKIGVNGFKDISEDDVTTSNTYGIKVAINYDNDGGLVFEESIPLQLFHAADPKAEWVFNIKLNSVEGAMLGGGPSSAPSSSAFGKEISGNNGRVTGLAGGGGGKGGGRKGADPTAGLGGGGSAAPGGTTTTPTIDFWGKFTLAQ